MFTATLIGILHDQGKLTIGDLISTHLPDDTLQGLFVFQGTDYNDTVTIRHLLGHTSGIADYFEGKVTEGAPFLDRLTDLPDKRWTPNELVDFTRKYQTPIGPPGTFGYTDTGYILLGLIIEKVAEMSFSEALEQYIFRPLEMNDSYLMFYGKPLHPEVAITPVTLGGKEITLNMLSCDWAGGGIVSTTHDLLKFQRALWKEALVSAAFVQEMQTFTNRSGRHSLWPRNDGNPVR